MNLIKSIVKPCAGLPGRAVAVLFLTVSLSMGFSAHAQQKTFPAGTSEAVLNSSATTPVELGSRPGVSKFPSLPLKPSGAFKTDPRSQTPGAVSRMPVNIPQLPPSIQRLPAIPAEVKTELKAAGEKIADMLNESTSETQTFTKGALSYQLPAGYSGTFEASIDKLYMKKDELPANLIMAKISKMKTNPQLSTTKSDFDKITKEAFRSNISSANWRVAHTSFYKGKDADDDTVYICVAVEYKRDISERSFQKDIEILKNYLKKETSDEYVLLEKFPFMIVMGSNQTGDYEFATVKEIAARLKVKLFGDIKVEPAAIVYPEVKPAAADISGGDKTGETKINQAPAPPLDANNDTGSVTIENGNGNGAKAGAGSGTETGNTVTAEAPGGNTSAVSEKQGSKGVSAPAAAETRSPAKAVSRTISEDKKAAEPKNLKKKDTEIISIEDITPDEQ